MVPLPVGLVGAGPWASMVTGPVLAAGPETVLAGVWSRTASSAEALAARLGVPAFDRYEALLDGVGAVAFSVPPSAQAELAPRAAAAGKALLLEKPLADDVAGAERVAAAVAEAGVGSLVVLSYRFTEAVRGFLAEAAGFGAIGGRASFVSGAFLGGPFATGWRLERGVVLDVGPHVLDLVDAALGPIVGLRAAGDPQGWVSVVCEHEGGAVSDVAMTCRAAIEPSRTDVELYGPGGVLAVDAREGVGPASFGELRRAFAAAAAGERHGLDAARGLYLQHLVAAVEADLAR